MTSYNREIRKIENKIWRIEDDKYEDKISEDRAAFLTNKYELEMTRVHSEKDKYEELLEQLKTVPSLSLEDIHALCQEPSILVNALIRKIWIDVNGNVSKIEFECSPSMSAAAA
ncbi:hypothetical protein [Paenibacillus sp. D51F]